MELFEIRPLNFLVKPISNESIIMALEKAMKLSGICNTCFNLKKGLDVIRIPYGAIDYFESDGRKIKVHVGDVAHDMYEKMSNIELELPAFFVRMHQSYIVNTARITRWKATEVYISDSITIPISRNYRKKVCSYLINEENGDN